MMAVSGTAFELNFAYNGRHNDVSSSTSYTFSNKAIGQPNADRWVVVAVGASALGDCSGFQVTVGGQACQAIGANSFFTGLGPAGIAYAKVTSGSTADIVVSSMSGAVNCTIAVYSFNSKATGRYGQVNNFTGSADASSILLSNLKCSTGGVVIYATSTSADSISSVWNGTDSVVEDTDADTETTNVSTGHVLTTETSEVRDLTCSLSPAARGEAQCISFAFIT